MAVDERARRRQWKRERKKGGETYSLILLLANKHHTPVVDKSHLQLYTVGHCWRGWVQRRRGKERGKEGRKGRRKDREELKREKQCLCPAMTGNSWLGSHRGQPRDCPSGCFYLTCFDLMYKSQAVKNDEVLTVCTLWIMRMCNWKFLLSTSWMRLKLLCTDTDSGVRADLSQTCRGQNGSALTSVSLHFFKQVHQIFKNN